MAFGDCLQVFFQLSSVASKELRIWSANRSLFLFSKNVFVAFCRRRESLLTDPSLSSGRDFNIWLLRFSIVNLIAMDLEFRHAPR